MSAETSVATANTVDQLERRVRELERRVAVLEGLPEQPAPAEPIVLKKRIERERPPETWRGFPSPDVPSGAVAVLGKAVLGIAGAYLLRAIAESEAVPKLPVLILAVIYAAMWMVLAVRIRANRFASITYAVNSAVILSPLLWESTVRFQFLSPGFTGTILVGYVVLALALTWRHDDQAIVSIATIAALNTALALIIATHTMVPLTLTVLTVALATEIVVCMGHAFYLRAAPAIAADIAVWLLVYIMASAQGAPEGYRPASPGTMLALCFALLAIYAGSIGYRSFVGRERMTVFEVGQGVIAFGIATFGSLRVAHGAIAPALGCVFLALAVVCYWGALSHFVGEDFARNRRVSAAWSAGLLVAGTLLLFPAGLQVVFLSLAALVSAYLYTRTANFSLGLHSSVFLAAAFAVSTVPDFIADALVRTVPGPPDWTVWIVATAAGLCYVVGSHTKEEERPSRRGLWIFPILLAGAAIASVIVVGMVSLAGEVAASRLSMIRTVVNCALALGFAYCGFRWRRVELGWAAYTAVGFGTLKLVFEDLRFGNAASLVVSLLFYGLILILLPRMAKRRRSDLEAAADPLVSTR